MSFSVIGCKSHSFAGFRPISHLQNFYALDSLRNFNHLGIAAALRLERQQREGWTAHRQDVPKPHSIGGSLRKLAEMRSQYGGNGHKQMDIRNQSTMRELKFAGLVFTPLDIHEL